MKKTLLAVALSLGAMGSAFAAGIVGGAAVSGQAGLFQGSTKVDVASISNGSATSATLVTGNGTSKMQTVGSSGGTALGTGTVTKTGVVVATDTTFHTNVVSVGTRVGEAPEKVGDSYANATTGIADAKVGATATGTQATKVIGVDLAIAGIVGFKPL